MRLTLRYLLAYLDDYLLPEGSPRILHPEDFESIGRKIQESDFAKTLVERIQDVVRRARLGAPGEADGGAGLDPNTVAEYLDNALSDARVPDFEKVCLESDTHLAEVACCHQILAMVVTEPVEVDEDARQRIYQLPEALAMQAEDAESSLDAPGISEAPDELPSAPGRPQRGARAASRESIVPEYLRTTARGDRWTKGLVAAGLLVLIAAAALVLGGWSDSGNALSRILGWGPSESDEDLASDQPGRIDRATPAEDTSTVPPVEPPKPGDPRSAQPVSPPPVDGRTAETGKPGPPATPMTEPSQAAKAPQTAPQPAGEGHAADKSMPPPRPAATTPADPLAEAAEPQPGKSAGSGRSASDPVGMMASPKQLLLRLNAKSGAWLRVGDETVVYGNDRLMSPPAFRPRVALANRASIELIDATSLVLLPSVGKSPPGISVEFGRILAKADDAAGASLRIVAGDHSGVCRFADADCVVAIEVSRAEPGGADPETQPGPLLVDLYVTSGKVVWQDDQRGQEVGLSAPKRLSVSEQPLESVLLQQIPRWVSGDTASPLDQRAAAVLEREVVLGRSVILDLPQLISHRQREVRWLAMRTLSLVEDHRPLLAALDDPEQSRFWSDYVEQLRWAVVRSPQSAAKVRTAMEQQYGLQGIGLYEMLWKYRPDTLRPDDVNHLVNFLAHDALPFRILGFWNLKNLYHPRTLYYRPDDPASKRQASVQKWRDLLKASPVPRNGGQARPDSPARGHEPAAEPPP